MNNSSSSGRGGHSGVRRIMRELQELIAEDSDMYTVQPLENNIFEIHFTLRGGAGTDFQGTFKVKLIITNPCNRIQKSIPVTLRYSSLKLLCF